MLAVKYAATPFTRLNYSIHEIVRATVDLVVTACDGFKTSVTYTINQRARVKWVGRHFWSRASELPHHLLYTVCLSVCLSVGPVTRLSGLHNDRSLSYFVA